MKLYVDGTYRSRVRVNLLWFWIVRPWKTQEVHFAIEVPEKSTTAKFGEFTVTLATKEGGVYVELDWQGFRVYHRTFSPSEIDWIKDGIPVKVEPIKGAILDVVLALR